ncbi:hypothetical protein C483_18653 [Natrialba hulunbeirensis JCM 10989]|uniref:SHOCT domain-containing protein n=1 Tax=Natrialba hulunbeirensis JCM 10989 TaxID=1227493 RepID=L9ZQA2_9EURY|nr:SHOCT domain-containing protein [Natrialba hulunbeirensis]ELY87338.1 hypothetical protein C483_18653 [Natrialba hulunbeirensis JCM 10989]
MSTDDSLLRTIVIVIAVIVLLPLLMLVVALPMMGVWGGGHMWNGGGGMWDSTGATWMWLLMSVVPLLVLLGIGYLLYSAVRHSGGTQQDAAIEELRIAYARGEISEDEFENRRKRLQREE